MSPWTWGLIGGLALALIAGFSATNTGSGLQAFGLLIAVISAIGYWLTMLIEIATAPESAWREADQNRFAYLLLVVLLGIVGAWIYARSSTRRTLIAAR